MEQTQEPPLSPEETSKFFAGLKELLRDGDKPVILTADDLRKQLVSYTLTRFECPEEWPMTDLERIELLKEIYRRCREIETLQMQEGTVQTEIPTP